MVDHTARAAELRAMRDAATKGPWDMRTHDHGAWRIVNPEGDAELGTWTVANVWWPTNAALIAAAPDVFTELADLHEAYATKEAEVARLREALEPFAFLEDATTEEAWETRYRDRFQDWIDADDIERARVALKEPTDSGTICCWCGKTGLSTAEDGASECQLADGRWVCSSECYDAVTREPTDA